MNNTKMIEMVLRDLEANGKDWQVKWAKEALEELKFIRETARKVLERRTTAVDADLRAYLESMQEPKP